MCMDNVLKPLHLELACGIVVFMTLQTKLSGAWYTTIAQNQSEISIPLLIRMTKKQHSCTILGTNVMPALDYLPHLYEWVWCVVLLKPLLVVCCFNTVQCRLTSASLWAKRVHFFTKKLVAGCFLLLPTLTMMLKKRTKKNTTTATTTTTTTTTINILFDMKIIIVKYFFLWHL